MFICIFIVGNVRAESYTRPLQHFENSLVNGAQESRQEGFDPECTQDPTLGESQLDGGGDETSQNLIEDEEEILQKLATRQYYRLAKHTHNKCAAVARRRDVVNPQKHNRIYIR